jgi:hypothetical protein
METLSVGKLYYSDHFCFTFLVLKDISVVTSRKAELVGLKYYRVLKMDGTIREIAVWKSDKTIEVTNTTVLPTDEAYVKTSS